MARQIREKEGVDFLVELNTPGIVTEPADVLSGF